MTNEQIKEIALENGFKLKGQPNGDMDLNPYVYDFARALIRSEFSKVRETTLSLIKDTPETSQGFKEGAFMVISVINMLEGRHIIKLSEGWEI